MIKTLLSTFAILTLNIAIAQVPTSEREALIALYNSTDGLNWNDNTNWNTAEPVSDWFGVTVENIAGQDHVTQLYLDFNNLTGTLPSEIGNFPELTVLSIWDGNLNGTIPSEIGNLTKLETLSFEDNALTGNLPASFANLSSMSSLFLNGNLMSGTITGLFTNWTNLVYFSIGDINGSGSFNNFNGDLDFTNSPSMRMCLIENNDFSTLNVRNGNNANMSNGFFNASNNDNLSCLIVDDKNYSETTWMNIPANTLVYESEAECSLLGTASNNFDSSFAIYPNPTSGVLNIAYNGTAAVVKTTVLNLLGQTLFVTDAVQIIDMSAFPAGLYYLNFTSETGAVSTHKVIKN